MGEVLFPRVVQKVAHPLYLGDSVFANNTWAAIIEACQKNKVPESWAVGDQKPMIINGAEYVIDIIGKNHDTYADGSGIAPLTFQLHDCYEKTYQLNGTQGNSDGWAACTFRTTDLPTIIAAMPQLVRDGLHAVTKRTGGGYSNPGFRSTTDKLFLLSEVEIFGSNISTNAGEGTQYAYYAAGGSKIKKLNGAAISWWERSPNKNANDAYGYVQATGTHANGNPYYSEYGVAPAFCF